LLILLMLTALIAGLLLLRESQQIRRGAFYGGVNAGVWPDNKEVALGETFTLDLKISPNSSLVTGADIKLKFDPSIIELVALDLDALFVGPRKISQANENGIIQIIAVTPADKSKLYQQPFTLAKLVFKAKKTGSTEITRAGDYKIVGSRGQDGVIDRTLRINKFSKALITVKAEGAEGATPTQGAGPTQGVTPTEGATPTQPPSTGEWPVLNFKIKFAGTTYRVDNRQIVISDIPDQKVVLLVKKDDFEKKFEDVTVSFDEEAIGTGKVELVGVPAGEGYAVFIKGPVHLTRKFCYDKQKEHCWLGEEDVTLELGENDYDWSGLELELGDANGDDRIDALDFALLKQALGLEGKGIKEDFNFNGVVNSQDVALFLESFSSKYGFLGRI